MKSKIIMYGTTWCSDCISSKMVLDTEGIEYDFINIEEDTEAAKKVEEINNGMRSVPTIIFSDGSILVEPDVDVLQSKIIELK